MLFLDCLTLEDGTDRLPRKYGNELRTLLQVISQNMEDLIQLSALNVTSVVTWYIGVLIFTRVYQQCVILSIYGVKLFKQAIVLKAESYNLENTSHILYKYEGGFKSFRPDIQKPRQLENAARDI